MTDINSDFFAEIEDTFSDLIECGLTRDDVADNFGIAREEFNRFVSGDDYALAIERKAHVKYKLDIQRGRMEAVKKGNSTVLKSLSPEQEAPKLTVEFKRGDMRTPDEITISNTETGSKKSLASLQSLGGCSK